jgi:hypothetical protein
MFSFGSGVLIGTRTDVANSTPVNFGLIQEVTLDLSANTKELYGQYQYPVAVARGTTKVTGKAKAAKISGLAFANLYHGVTPTAGQTSTVIAEAGAVTTVTYAGAQTTAVEDLGVIYAATGLPLTKVASGPVTGQYSVTVVSGTITYTLATADPGKGAILVSYTYTIPTVGQQILVPNQLLGTTPTFSCKLFTTFQGSNISVQIFNAVASKLSFGTKLEDFVMPDFEFSCFANPAGNVMQWNFSDNS